MSAAAEPRWRRWTGRWRALAHAAAVLQSRILLFVFYYVIFMPVAVATGAWRQRRLPASPTWHDRSGPPPTLDDARRQF